MVSTLRAGESIEVRGFGSFGVRRRGPSIGRNPATGAAVHVPAKHLLLQAGQDAPAAVDGVATLM